MLSATPDQRKALVIDDDEHISHLIKFLLTREGFAVEVANDGRSAQQMIGGMEPPAIITLDVMLPHADGFELLRLIRATDGWQDVPLLMLTSRSHEHDIVRALDAGANDYLVKPFKPDELRARIRRLLRH